MIQNEITLTLREMHNYLDIGNISQIIDESKAIKAGYFGINLKEIYEQTGEKQVIQVKH